MKNVLLFLLLGSVSLFADINAFSVEWQSNDGKHMKGICLKDRDKIKVDKWSNNKGWTGYNLTTGKKLSYTQSGWITLAQKLCK